MSIEISEDAKDFLADVGFEPEYGARPLQRAIGNYIQDPLSVEILEGDFKSGDHVIVEVADDGESLTFKKGDGEELTPDGEDEEEAAE